MRGTAGPQLRVSALEANGPLQLPFASPQRWLSFPMYEHDSSHAVDLNGLRWRPDTLLESSTRYPMHGKEEWPAELFNQAWYIEAKRLVDCQTGRSLPISEALLAQDGRVLLTRASKASLRHALNGGSDDRKWLSSSEIGLACLAAADADLLNRRRDAARVPPPKLSHLPTRTVLGDDASALRARLDFRVDRAALLAGPAMPVPGREQDGFELLTRVAEQRAQWRRSIFGPGSEQMQSTQLWTDDADTRERLEEQVNRGERELPFRALPGWRFEHWVRVHDQPDAPPGADPGRLREADVVARQIGDCRAGSTLSLHFRWYAYREAKPVAERAATPEEMLQSLGETSETCSALRDMALFAQQAGLAEAERAKSEAEAEAEAEAQAKARAEARADAGTDSDGDAGKNQHDYEAQFQRELADHMARHLGATQAARLRALMAAPRQAGESAMAADAELLLLMRASDLRRNRSF